MPYNSLNTFGGAPLTAKGKKFFREWPVWIYNRRTGEIRKVKASIKPTIAFKKWGRAIGNIFYFSKYRQAREWQRRDWGNA